MAKQSSNNKSAPVADEREVLFMPVGQTTGGWRWRVDHVMGWRAPAFNGWEEDFLRSSPLIAIGSPPDNPNRLMSFAVGGKKVGASAASSMTMMCILSHERTVEHENYNKWVEALSPLRVLLRRLPAEEYFMSRLRSYVVERQIRLEVGVRGGLLYRMGANTYTDAPFSLCGFASELLHHMCLNLNGRYKVKTEAGYYELDDGQDNQQ